MNNLLEAGSVKRTQTCIWVMDVVYAVVECPVQVSYLSVLAERRYTGSGMFTGA